MKRYKVTEKRITVRWCYVDAENKDEAIELSVDVPDDRWEAFESHLCFLCCFLRPCSKGLCIEDVDYVETKASEVI